MKTLAAFLAFIFVNVMLAWVLVVRLGGAAAVLLLNTVVALGRSLVPGSLLLIAFLMANVVAAGMVFVLGLAFNPDPSSPWPWVGMFVIAAGAAGLFLKGCLQFLREVARVQLRSRGR